jgi:anti-anti-sigma factor
MAAMQCWQAKQCGREPGGSRAGELGLCPASTAAELDGLNHGANAGRMCWAAAGTFCGGEVQGTFAHKAVACLDCDVFAQVKAEEGSDFKFLVPGREFEEVEGLVVALRRVTDAQAATIRELSTPVLQVWDDVLVVPLIGEIDGDRRERIVEEMLHAVIARKASCVILDITGVAIVDTGTANSLLRMVQAVGLLGSRCVVTGIQPQVAQTLAEIGLDLSGVHTLRNLQAGLLSCLKDRRAEVVRALGGD